MDVSTRGNCFERFYAFDGFQVLAGLPSDNIQIEKPVFPVKWEHSDLNGRYIANYSGNLSLVRNRPEPESKGALQGALHDRTWHQRY